MVGKLTVTGEEKKATRTTVDTQMGRASGPQRARFGDRSQSPPLFTAACLSALSSVVRVAGLKNVAAFGNMHPQVSISINSDKVRRQQRPRRHKPALHAERCVAVHSLCC